MEEAIKTKTSTKIFCGFLLTSEVKMHLNESLPWKMAKMTPSPTDLKEVKYEEQDFLGRYLDNEKVTLSDLKKQEDFQAKTLQEYCPKLDISHCKFTLFSQFFVH